METNMLSADHSVYTLIIRKPSTPDLFSICLKRMLSLIAYFVKNHYFHFSGTPPTNDKILNLNFLEFGTDIFLRTFYGYLHYSTLCFGGKIISQGIILTLKVKVPGL